MRQWHLDPVPGYGPLVGRFVAMLEDTRRRLFRDLEDFDPADLDRTPSGSGDRYPSPDARRPQEISNQLAAPL